MWIQLLGAAVKLVAPRWSRQADRSDAGSSPDFEVEARLVPARVSVPCSSCHGEAEKGEPEQFFVTVHPLTSERYLRVRAVGICAPVAVDRKLRQLVRKPAWYEVKAQPVGGVDAPNFRSDLLRRFGERRDLPATAEAGNPFSFKLMDPTEWPWGIERGGKLRVWVGKPAKGVLVSDVIELPHLDEQEPSPRLCMACVIRQRKRQAQKERRRSSAESSE